MKKYKTIIVLLIMISQICSLTFASIVSDNDGSAFVTKAEFDALKNEFQTQINNYNSSIDGKIDGAIASYLAGIQISSADLIANYFDKYNVPGSTGIAWTASPSYVDNKNKTQETGWSINLEALASNGESGTKYLSYNTVKKNTYEKRVYFENGKITGFYEWEPIMTGAGMAMDFYHKTHVDGNTVPVYEGNNEFLWYNGITLTAANRKNGVTGNGGTFKKSYYEGTQWNVTYSEKIKDSGVPFVISPKSDATEYYINTADDYAWGATATTDLINPISDPSFTTTGWVKVAGAKIGINFSSGGSRMKGYVNITGKKRNEMIVKPFEDICSENGAMKYGVVLTQIEKNGDINAKVKCSGDGNVKIWVGNKTTDYTTSTNKAEFPVTAGSTLPISLTTLLKDDCVRIIYEPTSGVHTMDISDLVIMYDNK